MSVVVRCPECRGASRVAPAAVGQLVLCPRCHGPFLAVEEATPVARPTRRPDPPPPVRQAPRPRPRVEPVAPPPSDAPAAPPPDPHDRPLEGGLPASVLIGLALLPFVIPLLWLIAPMVFAQPPALSMAAPAALALAASALSLAVIYTVDWTPATRVKGVLMLVGLAYFAGFSLYFLKKDMVDRVKRAFDPAWNDFRPERGGYKVRMPGRPERSANQPLGEPLACSLECHQATYDALARRVQYWVGVGKDPREDRRPDAWFADVRRALEARGDGPVRDERPVELQDGTPGREWVLSLQEGTNRVVRVYRANGRVYYLAAEAVELDRDDDDATKFLGSLTVLPKE